MATPTYDDAAVTYDDMIVVYDGEFPDGDILPPPQPGLPDVMQITKTPTNGLSDILQKAGAAAPRAVEEVPAQTSTVVVATEGFIG